MAFCVKKNVCNLWPLLNLVQHLCTSKAHDFLWIIRQVGSAILLLLLHGCCELFQWIICSMVTLLSYCTWDRIVLYVLFLVKIETGDDYWHSTTLRFDCEWNEAKSLRITGSRGKMTNDKKIFLFAQFAVISCVTSQTKTRSGRML